MDFACGSGSLLLNVRKKVNKAGGTISKIFGQEQNITTYNLGGLSILLPALALSAGVLLLMGK